MNHVPPRIFFLLLASAALVAGDVMEIENRDGRKIEVTILALENESIRVRKADGKEFEIPLASLSEESVERIRQMPKADSQAEGDLPVVKVHNEDLSAEELKCLEGLYQAMKDHRIEEIFKPGEPKTLALKEDLDAIVNPLDQIHGKLTVKDRCARLLAIMRHEVQGGSVMAGIGAASCLTRINGSEATESMFQALEGNLSEAAELECMRGLGERCTGEVMDRVLAMFMSTDPKVKRIGGYTLSEIRMKTHLDELRGKAATVVNTAEAKDRLQAVYALIRNVK